MKRSGLLVIILLLSACGGSLPPPDWKLNAQSGLEAYDKQYLDGNTRLAELNFDKAKAAVARSGRLDMLARIELARCATRTAALDFDACPNYAPLAAEARPGERAYAEFLAGRWSGIDTQALPAHYAGLLSAGNDSARLGALAEMKSPQARLIGAALLFKQGALSPAGIALAIDTASERGWRRPLLAWLRVEAKRAEAAGDKDAIDRLQKRIELVLAATPAMAQ
jgi:hypothetical protein